MGKRLFDLTLTMIVLIVTFPILIVAAIFVRVRLGRPVAFIQSRPGLKGRPFKLLKLRTMTDARDASGVLLDDEARLTPLGKFLRSTSIDELPSLWNVLVGDMSLVGPRPLLMRYIPLYSPVQARRHEVRPGITGWAQINGRNTVDWDRKFELDVWYVDHRSFWLDLKILMLTVELVFRRKNINAEGQATMSAFTGSVPENP
jgi:lipopolysaccharide/colanic/teichoic acid biosynthesis glycosyltransferase